MKVGFRSLTLIELEYLQDDISDLRCCNGNIHIFLYLDAWTSPGKSDLGDAWLVWIQEFL